MSTILEEHYNHAGWWQPNGCLPATGLESLRAAIYNINSPVLIVEKDGDYALGSGGIAQLGEGLPDDQGYPIVGYAAPIRLCRLGDPTFCADYNIKYPYLTGAMANGIGSTEIVEAMGKAGMLGFFGAAGLALDRVEAAIDRIDNAGGSFPFGFNLIHSPNEPDLEAAVVDLYLRRGVDLVEASAFLGLTPAVVRYRVHGIYRNSDGKIITPNRIIAKISRIEVATKFFSPPPDQFLRDLVVSGDITEEQAEMASQVPMAQDVTVEADSGGHTDNQQAVTLFPTILSLRDRIQAQYRYQTPLRVGVGGGVATPASASALFSMGAAYVVTGTINQCTQEAGTSDIVRKMLAEAQQADITMAPAADMFEMGVNVQVLKRGTMFAMRGAKLYDIYRSYDGIDSIPEPIRENIEKSIFRQSLKSVWEDTRTFFQVRDPRQVSRAEADPKHKMALVFRWYLGQSSRWANAGEAQRKIDYQIWCGPAMGAFNEWVKGSFLEDPDNRHVVIIALNILYGTAVSSRMNTLRYQGIRLSSDWMTVSPLDLDQIKEYL